MDITVFDQRGERTTGQTELTTLLASKDALVWVDMIGPTDADVVAMQEHFGFHALAIEDTRNQRQRPKVEEYPDHLFVILNPAERDGQIADFRELDVFVGQNYIVTVHRGEEPLIDEALRRLSHDPAANQAPGHLLYVLMDSMVDAYFHILDQIGEEIDELEDLLLLSPNSQNMARLLSLRRSLLVMSRIVSAQRDMFTFLERPDLPFLAYESLQYHMRDVQDHVLRVSEALNLYRDVLTTLVELHTTAVSNRLNQVVNRLTVVTIAVGTLGFISGFYGMNFERTWPPFGAAWGVPLVLIIMIGAIILILSAFKRLRWF